MADLGVKIFRQEAKFIAGAAQIKQLPKLFLPQVAFLGKSNVGKSSLINAICRRKALARVSHTPGRTQQINFFTLADKLILDDLPGYGFAKVPQSQKQNWEKLILHYLENSDTLKLVNLLIDARRGIKEHDLQIISLLTSFAKKFQIVFTKADKIGVGEEEKFLNDNKNYLSTLGYDCGMLLTSSRKAKGIKELQASAVENAK